MIHFQTRAIIDNPNHDFDEDGLTEVEGDCDDNDEDIQKIIWYVDGDGDGYGLESLQTESCTRPEGYTDQLEDCDDSNAMYILKQTRFAMRELLTTIVMGKWMMKTILYNKAQQNTSLKTKDGDGFGDGIAQQLVSRTFLVWLTTKMIATMKT